MPPSSHLEVEIGCGQGFFLISRAKNHPEKNFVGIDRAGKWLGKARQRGENLELKNLKFVWGEVEEILEIFFEPESVNVFHIYFPDPWPKRSHHRRRSLNTEFFKLLQTRLKKNGLIEIATDDHPYFEEICALVSKKYFSWNWVRQSLNERLFPAIEKTAYESKYSKEGRDLFYLEVQK